MRNTLDEAVSLLVDCFAKGGKLLVCGNGGSSADSAHIVGELVKGFLKKRPLPAEWNEALGENRLQMGLPALDLTAQGAVIAAIVNDQIRFCFQRTSDVGFILLHCFTVDRIHVCATLYKRRSHVILRG